MKFEDGVVFKELIMGSCFFKNHPKEVAMHGILLVQGLKNNWAKSSPRFVGFRLHRFGGFPPKQCNSM